MTKSREKIGFDWHKALNELGETVAGIIDRETDNMILEKLLEMMNTRGYDDGYFYSIFNQYTKFGGGKPATFDDLSDVIKDLKRDVVSTKPFKFIIKRRHFTFDNFIDILDRIINYCKLRHSKTQQFLKRRDKGITLDMMHKDLRLQYDFIKIILLMWIQIFPICLMIGRKQKLNQIRKCEMSRVHDLLRAKACGAISSREFDRLIDDAIELDAIEDRRERLSL